MKYQFKNVSFESTDEIKCNICNSNLILKKKNIKNIKSNIIFVIEKCSNLECPTKHSKKIDLYKHFLPEHESKIYLDSYYKKLRKRNIYCIEYWLEKGFTEEDGYLKISELQKNNYSKSDRSNIICKSKKTLKDKGYSDEDIKIKMSVPTQKIFWINQGFTEEQAVLKIKEIQSNNSKKRKIYSSNCNIEYFLKQGFTEDEAKVKLSERQSTFSKKKCIEKYGEEKGLKLWKERQEKWQKSLHENTTMKVGYSKISQELFDKILSYYPEELKEWIYFANNNYELFLEKDNKYYFYDFVDIKNKFVIEYNGDIYHANPLLYKENDKPNPYEKDLSAKNIWEKDLEKENIIKLLGYKVIYVWDSEYKKDKRKVLNKCLKILKLK